MKLTLKKTIKGQVVDESTHTFTNLEAYLSFFDHLGVEISPEEAIDDLQRAEMTYRMPILSTEIQ